MNFNQAIGADVHPSSFYPELIEWKLNQLDEMNDSEDIYNSLSISIIIDCACLAEGVINTISKELLRVSTGEDDSIQSRLVAMIEEKAERASFNESINTLIVLLDKRRDEIFSNELWKAIKMMFTFRNKLVHGKIIEILDSEKDNGREVYGSYKGIYEYLLEKKLLDRFNNNYENFLFQKKVLEYFYLLTMQFIKDLSVEVPGSVKDYVYEMIVVMYENKLDKLNLK